MSFINTLVKYLYKDFEVPVYRSVDEGSTDWSFWDTLETISVVEGVDVDPLDGSEWGQHFAVVESGSVGDEVIGWGSHHWGSDGLLCLGSIVLVAEILPNPEWTSIVWTFVCTHNHLLSELVVSLDCLWAGVLESPVKCFLVDFSASVADLIVNVEVIIVSSCSLLEGLSGLQFDFHFDSTDFA